MGIFHHKLALVLLLVAIFQSNDARFEAGETVHRPKIYLTSTFPPNLNTSALWISEKIISFGIGPTREFDLITLTCNATIPIDWDFEGKFGNSVSTMTRKRKVDPKEPNDTNAYLFEVEVVINDQSDYGSSGLYICYSLETPSVHDSLTVLTEPSRKSGDKYELKSIRPRLDDKMILLPCVADATPVFPSLIKIITLNGVMKQTNITKDAASYKLTEGFYLNVEDDDTIGEGDYVCILQYSFLSPYRIRIKVESPQTGIYAPLAPEHRSPVMVWCASNRPVEMWIGESGFAWPNATYYKNESSPYSFNAVGKLDGFGEVLNCVNTARATTIASWTLVFPENVGDAIISTKLGDFSEGEIECHNPSSTPTQVEKYECDTPAICNFQKKGFNVDENCEKKAREDLSYLDTRLVTPRPIVARCPTPHLGKNTLTLLLDLDRNFFELTDALSISRSRLVRLRPAQGQAFIGELVNFTCVAVRYLFADVEWVQHFKNGSTLMLASTTTRTVGLDGDEDESSWRDEIKIRGITQQRFTLIRMDDPNLIKVSCYAPFWHSFEWAIASHFINVTERKPPEIVGSNWIESISLAQAGEETRLVCEITSHPKPNVTWSSSTSPNFVAKIETNQVSEAKLISVLTLPANITLDEETTHTCSATNLFGSTSKTFKTSTPKSIHPTIIVAIVIAFLALIIGTLFLLRRQRKKLKALQNLLTEQDVKEFLEGSSELSKLDETNHQAKPFPEEYRIQRDSIELDETNVLGFGAYGIVWKANMKGCVGDLDGNYENVEEKNAVAVKTVKQNAEVQYVKSLLAEIKTMAHVGTHPNVVNFLGACVQNIWQNQVFLVLEFCPNGSLESYLKKGRERFQSSDPSEMEYSNINQGQLTTRHLVQWAEQITQAMIYLAQKQVIHGDLATRNVLLSENLVAKIADFGLAKQLYNYAQFIRKGKELLPWRWMAVESLRDMEFSVRSDVWSFGVTFWEIFSLAEVPYGGLGYTLEFVNMLKLGFRLPKPPHASAQIYQIMLECWEPNSSARPTMEMIERMLQLIGKSSNVIS